MESVSALLKMLFHRQLRDGIPTSPRYNRLHRDWIISAQQLGRLDKSGQIVEVLPNRQYRVKLGGSGHLSSKPQVPTTRHNAHQAKSTSTKCSCVSNHLRQLADDQQHRANIICSIHYTICKDLLFMKMTVKTVRKTVPVPSGVPDSTISVLSNKCHHILLIIWPDPTTNCPPTTTPHY